jgi:hypothetical protein
MKQSKFNGSDSLSPVFIVVFSLLVRLSNDAIQKCGSVLEMMRKLCQES